MVTPETRFVTLGGAIAADVHGKNHHKDGSFRACVDWIDVMRPDGEIRQCSRQNDAILFEYTLGGMKPTGIILCATIRLRRVETAWIRQTTIVAPNIKEPWLHSRRHRMRHIQWPGLIASGRAAISGAPW